MHIPQHKHQSNQVTEIRQQIRTIHLTSGYVYKQKQNNDNFVSIIKYLNYEVNNTCVYIFLACWIYIGYKSKHTYDVCTSHNKRLLCPIEEVASKSMLHAGCRMR